MKRLYIVSTHLGNFETWAASADKAISNIRFRLFGRGHHAQYTAGWTAKEAA